MLEPGKKKKKINHCSSKFAMLFAVLVFHMFIAS